MAFPILTVAEDTNPPKAKKKGRAFSAYLLGYFAANPLWDCPRSGSSVRPIWLTYYSSDQESRAFTANLRAGRRVSTGRQSFEIPRAHPYRWLVQKVPGGTITVAYLPELFHLEPGPKTDPVQFLFAPPRWWAEEQAKALRTDFGDDAIEAALAALFCAFIDRRTPLPLVHDLRFQLQLYRAALGTGWLHTLSAQINSSSLLIGEGAEACGLVVPVACDVAQATLEAFLVEQTSQFHPEEIRRGQTDLAADRGLLPFPVQPFAQLRLDPALA
jgi:hypothetical protein